MDKNSSTYLGTLVFACGDEVCSVRGELDVVDLVIEFMSLDVLKLLSGLYIESHMS